MTTQNICDSRQVHRHAISPNGLGVQSICAHCVINDPGPKGADPESRRRAEMLDFAGSGPPLLICDVCGGRYKEWEVASEKWSLLPAEYHSVAMCEDDFLRLLKEAGNDTSAILFTHKGWEWKLGRWEGHKDTPKHHTHIRVHDRETMWCEALEAKASGTFVVRLLNSSILDESLTVGTYILAKWNGSRRHGYTGRPILQPICQMNPPRSGKKTRKSRASEVVRKRNPNVADRTRPNDGTSTKLMGKSSMGPA